MEFGILCLLSPLLTILLAMVTKKVTLSLFVGIFSGLMVINGGSFFSALTGTLDSVINVFTSLDNVKVFAFNLLMGAFIVLIQTSGGVDGVINYLTVKTQKIKSRKMASALAYLIGILVFIDGYLSILLTGIVTRPLTDRFKVSREMLSYICDSTSAPINALIPLNSWGAMLMGLIGAQVTAGVITGSPATLLIQSLPFQFYSIVAVLSVGFYIFTEKHWGPMKKAEERVKTTGEIYREGANPIVSKDTSGAEMKEGLTPSIGNLFYPLFTLLGMILVGLLITGKGNVTKGDGTTAILWGILLSLTVAFVLYTRIKKIFTSEEFFSYVYKGMSGMMSLVILLMFAFANGSIVSKLGAGAYMANLVSENVPAFLCAAIIFFIGAVVSFSTGTSWGTFAIMMPIAIPMAVSLNTNVVLAISAVISGGIFGDHCSPVSDTTILSSMAASADHYDHVSTQLPYAVAAAAIAFVLYIITGYVLA